MPRYYFHLAGEIPAQDAVGHDCANDREAQDHADFIARRIGIEKPEMVKSENYILVGTSVSSPRGHLCRVVPRSPQGDVCEVAA
jgi:hypothetical protein